MTIIIPKVRNESKFNANSLKILNLQKQYNSKNGGFTFKEYCEFSLLFLDAPDTNFLKTNNHIKMLVMNHKKIIYQNAYLTAKQINETRQTGDQIIKMIQYEWQVIIKKIQGKSNKNQSNYEDVMQINSDENINLHFARLEEMLTQLRQKKFRWHLFTKEYEFIRRIQETQIKQQITFTKLLQTIIENQSKKIQNNRKNYRNPQKQSKQIYQEQKLQISQVIKAGEYFKKKYETRQQKNEQKIQKTPFDEIEERRKFNLAALRYHYAYFKND